ncbi:putative [Protein-PII] uridylyltransferase [Dioscorea sansibarensis]
MDSYGDVFDVEDDVFARLISRLNPPRVVIDNESCDNATVIRVDCVKKHGVLLEVIQVLIDLHLIITKAYISSDGSWFMDVFNVTDCDGNKVWDKEILNCIQRRLETDACCLNSPVRNSVGVMPSEKYTSIELIGSDRPGLLSEVCAGLTDLKCNVVKAKVWTHNARIAAVLHVTDESNRQPVEDTVRLSTIKQFLFNVLKGDGDLKTAKMSVSGVVTHTDRRLHQMMFDDRDYERVRLFDGEETLRRPNVVVMDCAERDYTVVILRSKDRPKLLFDAVCTLTDMDYIVFHGTVNTGNEEAYQEYYIRHVDGSPIQSESDRKRMIQCLQAAIERRTSEGLELEIRAEDTVGLLSNITRIFRENGLWIRQAEISTENGEAIDTFYISEISGNNVEAKTIESIKKQIGKTSLRVKNSISLLKSQEETSASLFLFANFFKGYSFQNFRLIRSCS